MATLAPSSYSWPPLLASHIGTALTQCIMVALPAAPYRAVPWFLLLCTLVVSCAFAISSSALYCCPRPAALLLWLWLRISAVPRRGSALPFDDDPYWVDALQPRLPVRVTVELSSLSISQSYCQLDVEGRPSAIGSVRPSAALR
jgi:hypothetical protein